MIKITCFYLTGKPKKREKQTGNANHALLVVWGLGSICQLFSNPPLQGSEVSTWTTGHFTADGFDIFQNFPDLNSILWDAEDKGLVPKIFPNHHVQIPEDFQYNTSVRS